MTRIQHNEKPNTGRAEKDAEFILETLMHRMRWAATDRNAIAEFLRRIVAREQQARGRY